MKTSDVIGYFGTQANAARALGITRGSVALWGEYVPEGRAYQVQCLSGGKLKVDPSFYATRRSSQYGATPAFNPQA